MAQWTVNSAILYEDPSTEIPPSMFSEIIPMHDFLMSHRTEPLLGKYLLWDYQHGRYGYRCGFVDENFIKDIRLFQLDFIIHHNLRVAIP